MATLESNTYGKHKVRVLKVHRADDGGSQVCEIEADVLLTGDLDGSYLSDDNSSIVPTDTVKNTVTVLAHDHLGTCRTSFAKLLCEHFIETYAHLDGVSVELRERRWDRMEIDGKPHGHSYAAQGNGEWYVRAEYVVGMTPLIDLRAGIRDHLIMKTTGSGFEGYNQCELTTLPPTKDRILATRLTGEWVFADDAENYAEVDSLALAAAYRVFAETYSPSVQRTLFQIGEAILEVAPQVEEVELTMPNVHFLGIDLAKLDRPNQKTVFLPTDEPHGQISAVVAR